MRFKPLLAGMLLLGATYFAVFGGDYNAFDLRRVRQERAAEEQRVEDARIDVEMLRAWRDSLATDSATIERIARERYGLIRDGERLYRFADSVSASAPPPTAVPAGPNAGAPD